MTEHLTEQQIESFHRRKMSPEGLRVAHQHIAICETCRARFSAPGQVALAFAAFERELQQEVVEDDHLHYRQLSGYVDDELREIDREIVESHLEICAECAAEMRDLRAFKAAITPEEHETIKPPSGEGRSLTWWNWWALWSPARRAVAVLSILLILTAGLFLLRARFLRQDPVQLAQSPKPNVGAVPRNLPPLPSPTAPPPPSRVKPEGEPAQPPENERARSAPSSPVIVALKDGDALVTLDSSGHLSGVAARAPGVQRLLAVALRSQRLEKPPALGRLIRESSTQLNIPGGGSQFALQRPVGTMVESDRPAFIWEPLKGASSYIVSVFDAQLNEVARSEATTATTWRPPRALRRGAIYRWQVTAVKDGREEVLPSPTAPEAKFQILDEQQAAALAHARQRYANSHLALGALYAQSGLLDEAETELQALVKDNPTSAVAGKLLQSLQAWRPTRSKTAR